MEQAAREVHRSQWSAPPRGVAADIRRPRSGMDAESRTRGRTPSHRPLSSARPEAVAGTLVC